MSNAVLKTEVIGMETEMDNDKLNAFRRVHYTPPKAPVFILESEDIAKLNFKMPRVDKLPLSLFIDVRGHVHFEINHSSYFLKEGFVAILQKLINPEKYFYDLLRTNIIEGSLLKNERKLIGGGIATYEYKTKTLEIKIYGILNPEDCRGMDPYTRKNAFAELSYWLRPIAEWLGAKRIITSPCVIHPNKMKKIGWSKLKMTAKEKFEFLKSSFPLFLVRRQNVFICDVYKRFIGNEARTFSGLAHGGI